MGVNTTLFVHPGMPKTGSTDLQPAVFSYAPELNCLKPASRIVDRAIHEGDLSALFKRSPAVWHDLGARFFDDPVSRSTRRSMLVSDEGMMGGMGTLSANRFFYNDPAWIGRHLDYLKHVAHTARFDRVKALILIR